MRLKMLIGACAVALAAVGCAQSDAGITTAVKNKLIADDLVKALERAHCDFFVAAFTTDWRFSPARSREIVDALIRARKNVVSTVIDTPDGHDARPDVLQVIGDGGPALGILQRADHAPRLVEHEVNERLGDDHPTIDLDACARTDLHAELALDAAVHPDSARSDELFGVTSGSHAGASQHLL